MSEWHPWVFDALLNREFRAWFPRTGGGWKISPCASYMYDVATKADRLTLVSRDKYRRWWLAFQAGIPPMSAQANKLVRQDSYQYQPGYIEDPQH